MTLNTAFVHPSFSIFGQAHDPDSLLVFAQELLVSHVEWQRLIGQFFIDWLDASPSILIKTSGTTKGPKEIKVSKSAMMAHAKMSCDFFNLKPADKIAHVLSNEFIAGKMILVRALTMGLDLWYYKPAAFPLKGVETVFDWVSMVPMQLAQSLSSLAQIKNLLVGGAPMNETLKRDVLEAAQRHNTKIYVSFGMTETLSHIAVAALTTKQDLHYKTLPGISISTDHLSCLHIQAPYLKEPVHTSDIVSLLDPHTFIWKGRGDYLINSGGVKLQPETIEAEFSTVLDIPFYFHAISDPTLGEKLCLVISSPNLEQAFLALENFTFSKPYYKPKSILVVPTIMYTDSHKVKREASLSGGFSEHPLKELL